VIVRERDRGPLPCARRYARGQPHTSGHGPADLAEGNGYLSLHTYALYTTWRATRSIPPSRLSAWPWPTRHFRALYAAFTNTEGALR